MSNIHSTHRPNRRWLAAAVIALAVGLAACGSDGNDDSQRRFNDSLNESINP